MAGYSPTRNFTPAQRQAMDRITSGLPTKSAKMRALEGAGYSRSDIAAYLGTSYQHVRSVLGAAGTRKESPLASEPPPTHEQFENMGVVEADAVGRIQLPAHVLAALEAEEGMAVLWKLEGDKLTLYGRRSGLRAVQDEAQRYIVPGEELASDQLIRERREEARREELKDRQMHG